MKNVFINKQKVQVYPNQKLIKIHKEDDAQTNFNYINNAIKDLSCDSFALYMFLYGIDNNTVYALSSAYMYENSALTKRTYTKAVNELIDKGYLVKGELVTDNDEVIIENVYNFYSNLDTKESK